MMQPVRTTVTLEPEAVRLLKEAMRRRGQPFDEVLNLAVRKGLADLEGAGGDSRYPLENSPVRLPSGRDPIPRKRFAGALEAQAFLDLTVRLEEQSERR